MIDYNRKLSKVRETQVPKLFHPKECLSLYCFTKILSISFMLFCEQYLTTTGPDSNLNVTAVDIKTLYALMNSTFLIETINLGRSIVYINGSQLIFVLFDLILYVPSTIFQLCVVSLSKNINPSLVLVQPRKTRPFITE